jgi:putative membrane protein
MNSLLAPLAAISLEGLGAMALYSLVGVGLAIVGYKLFDLCTPGDLHDEIIKNRNSAAAIVSAAVILGVCLIIAAAIVG